MIICSTYGPMSLQGCVDNQLSPYQLYDFCEKCQEGVRVAVRKIWRHTEMQGKEKKHVRPQNRN